MQRASVCIIKAAADIERRGLIHRLAQHPKLGGASLPRNCQAVNPDADTSTLSQSFPCMELMILRAIY
ncbi:hypothetical protein M514_04271 [Trichuris suis]|uniref:Uncharacterized protein n=1 Tax=Trichuris suis TaxID=68888 RepID=A0A085MC91_9BILA|nr:hypothetical protein M513_04271 [Trichuris suis]KFD71708.1 hypothetical protein M514_04271 [Trichuris suis]